MTAKHRKGKSNHKHDENSVRHDAAEPEARGGRGSGSALLLAPLLLALVGGASGAWFYLQQHQSVTRLAESFAGLQRDVAKLQALREEATDAGGKLLSTESFEQRLHALEEAHSLAQRQAGVSAAEQPKTSDLSAQVLAFQAEMKARLAEIRQDTAVDEQLEDLQSAIRARQEEMEVASQELSALRASQSEQANSLAELSEVLATTETRLEERDKEVEVVERQLEGQAVELLGLKRSLVRHEAQLDTNAQDIAHVKELLEAEKTMVKEQLSMVLQNLKEQSAISQSFQAELQAQMEAIQKQLEKGRQRDVAILQEKTAALTPEEEQWDKPSEEEESVKAETTPEDEGEQDEQEMPVSEAQDLEVAEGAEAQGEDVQEELEQEAAEGEEQEATEAQEEEAAQFPEEDVTEEQEQNDDGLLEEEILEENLVSFEEEVQVQSPPIQGSSPLEVQVEAPDAGDEEDDDEGDRQQLGEEESSPEREYNRRSLNPPALRSSSPVGRPALPRPSSGTMQACLPRSYLTPVRDEEAESQRKARSRQARQTRRSTQGVTLTELKEAQSIFGQTSSDRPADGSGLERRAVAKDGGLFQGVDAPSRDPEESHLKWDVVVDELGNLRPETEGPPPSCTSSPAGCSVFDPLPSLSNRPSKGLDENANERRDGGRSDADTASELALASRERRPARERDQGTGASDQVQEHDRASRLDSGSGSSSSESAADRVLGRAGSYTRRENRLASLSKTDDEGGTKEYKKMYEDALAENEKLKSRLEDSKQELAKIRIQLEKVTQKHDRISERSSILETEKREKRILEKKVSDMEEELKVLTELKSDNQRLKDENGALIRVISKLSK